jgi:polysaccharide biosynthesis protein PslH
LNILFLAHRIPYPPNKGDKIRSFNEIKYLSKKHDIFLGTVLDSESDRENINGLQPYCKEICAVHFNKTFSLAGGIFRMRALSVSNFYSRKLQKFVDDTVATGKIDAVMCFCSSMAEYVFRNPALSNGSGKIKLIMDFVDLDSDKWLQYSRYTRFPQNIIYRLEHGRLADYEVRIQDAFDHCIFVSQRELDVFKGMRSNSSKIHVVPNGVDFEYFARPEGTIKPSNFTVKPWPLLVFTGFMDYFANEDGAKWFCEKIFPGIRKNYPTAEFYIVGNQPSTTVRGLSAIDGVTVTGYVEDIREFYWMADICVIPLRIARGMQNKVLEAMAAGNAVVATSNASDGIVCSNNVDIVIADDEQAFADRVIELLGNEDARKELGRKAAQNIRARYSWEDNLKAFDELLK